MVYVPRRRKLDACSKIFKRQLRGHDKHQCRQLMYFMETVSFSSSSLPREKGLVDRVLEWREKASLAGCMLGATRFLSTGESRTMGEKKDVDLSRLDCRRESNEDLQSGSMSCLILKRKESDELIFNVSAATSFRTLIVWEDTQWLFMFFVSETVLKWEERTLQKRWNSISSDSQDDQHENNQWCFSETMSCSFITADNYCLENERRKKHGKNRSSRSVLYFLAMVQKNEREGRRRRKPESLFSISQEMNEKKGEKLRSTKCPGHTGKSNVK